VIRRLIDRLLFRAYRLRWRLRDVHRRYLERTRPRETPAGPSRYLLRLPTPGRPARFALERPGHIEDQLVEQGSYEPYITDVLLFLMKEDGLFVDVGANIGLHALQVAGAFPRSRCLCFEPHPSIHEDLRRNIGLSGFANVDAHPLALGDAPGVVDFFLHGAGAYNKGLSSLQPTPDMEGDVRRAQVRMTTLDAFLSASERERVSVVKIDVQGAERRVLAGMRETLARSRAAVVFEFESDYAEDPPGEIRGILDAVPEHRVFRIRPGRPEIEPFDPATVDVKGYWANLLALPRDGWGT
jgi:FkbM family methyltransferase